MLRPRIKGKSDSESAFNAIISASVVALGVSYGMPIAINCMRGRKMLPASRRFRLSGIVGWAANLVSMQIVEPRACTNSD